MKHDGLNRGIRTFQRLIALAWPELSACAEAAPYQGMLEDWLQCNWEMVVEGSLPPGEGIILEIYGDGADCNDPSSRVFRPEWLANHRVVCVARHDVPVLADLLGKRPIPPGTQLVFDELVTMRDGWYYRDAPFDCVLVDDGGTQRVIAADAVDFVLEKLSAQRE